jgi:two-component SAPR family response regulator
LWFDKTEKGAKNNRSVNIGKLKAILDKVGNLKVSKDTGYWRIETNSLPVYIDYVVINTILKDPVAPERDTVEHLLSIIQRGVFLSGTDYEWLDEFKSRVSANITEYLLRYTTSVTLNKEPQFLIALSNAILSIDPVSEEAMLLKCKTLNHIGKNTMARSAYEKFCRDYRSLFDNDYPKAFEAVVG